MDACVLMNPYIVVGSRKVLMQFYIDSCSIHYKLASIALYIASRVILLA